MYNLAAVPSGDQGAYYAAYLAQQPELGPAAPPPVEPVQNTFGVPLTGDEESDRQLLEHLAREQRQAKGKAQAGPQVVEINGSELHYKDFAEDAIKNAVAIAYGAEYETKLRALAGGKPGGKAKSKNQIGTLLYNVRQPSRLLGGLGAGACSPRRRRFTCRRA